MSAKKAMLTPAQRRVLARFKGKRLLKSHPDYWQTNDTLPLRALIAKGLLKYELGPYRDDYYVVTSSGAESLLGLPLGESPGL